MSNASTELIRLNKYLAANSDITSRRQADLVISEGRVKVNGKKCTKLGTTINPYEDKVELDNKTIQTKVDHKYVLLNKPKNYITTTSDDRGRLTVMDLVKNSNIPDLKPVGRLDRLSTGLLLLTNDNELINQLTHPSFEIEKLYKVEVDKPVTKRIFDAMLNGVELEDGFFTPDEIALLEDKKTLGIKIHSGKNRILRRFVAAFGFNTVRLDRVVYAGLTKYKLERGKWRFLTKKEVRLIKKPVKKRG